MQSSSWNFDALPSDLKVEEPDASNIADVSTRQPESAKDYQRPSSAHATPTHHVELETPKNEDADEFADHAAPEQAPEPQGSHEPGPDGAQQPEQPGAQPFPPSERDCWLCHESEQATYEPVRSLLGGTRYKKVYRSEEPSLGRLITPCLCKGTMKYIHEGCLRDLRAQGRQQDVSWKCARCGFSYRIQRLTWAQYIRSPLLSLAITIAILMTVVFLLGFIADPILGLYMDPVGTISDTVASKVAGLEDYIPEEDDEEDGWVLHFIKGIFSLGVLGFAKAFLAMSPWQWYNLRATGVVGAPARRRGTGRDRVQGMNLVLVIIGVGTFLMAVYRGTRAWTEKTLDRAAERVLNVRKDDDSDDEDDFDEDKKTQ